MDFLPELTFGTEFSQNRRDVLSLEDEEALFKQFVLQGALWHKAPEGLAARPLGFKDGDGDQSDQDEEEDASEQSVEEDDEDGEESGRESNGMSDADSNNDPSDSEMSQEEVVNPGIQNAMHSIYEGAGFGSGSSLQLLQGISEISGQLAANSSSLSLGVMPVPNSSGHLSIQQQQL